MSTPRNFKIKLVVTAVASILAMPFAAAFAAFPEVLSSGDMESMSNWYGRAGGLAGSDRVMTTQRQAKGSAPVGMVFDHDVAARTNMSLDRNRNAGIGITYDEDVAARTNNSRAHAPAQSLEAVGVANERSATQQ
jgi:hypothetical protein